MKPGMCLEGQIFMSPSHSYVKYGDKMTTFVHNIHTEQSIPYIDESKCSRIIET